MAAVLFTFERSWPAEASHVRTVREAVADFATCHGIRNGQLRDVQLAVSEVVTNAIVHAYPDERAGEIAVRASVERGRLFVYVRDWGGGMTPRPDSPGMGLGLPMVAQLAHSFTITAAPDNEGGTEVRLCFELDAA